MCLAIPGRVEEIEYPFATVSFGGARKKIRIDLLESVEVGEIRSGSCRTRNPEGERGGSEGNKQAVGADTGVGGIA